MAQIDLHPVFISQMSCQRIGSINASVLSAGASKVHRQIGEAAFDVIFNRNINNIKYTVQEVLHSGLSLQKLHYRSVPSVIFLILIIASRVFNSPAIENKHFLAHHQQENALITVAVTERETSRYLLFNKYNRLVGWRNKKTGEEKIVLEAKDIFEKAYSGLAIFQPEALDLITLRGKFSLIDAYLQLAPENKIAAYDHTGERMIDVGKPESVAKAEQMFA